MKQNASQPPQFQGMLFPLSNRAAYKPSGISNGCLYNWTGGSHAGALVWGVSNWWKEIYMHWINKPCAVDCTRKRQAHLNIWFKDKGVAEDTILPAGWSQAQIWPHRWHILWAKTGCISIVKKERRLLKSSYTMVIYAPTIFFRYKIFWWVLYLWINTTNFDWVIIERICCCVSWHSGRINEHVHAHNLREISCNPSDPTLLMQHRLIDKWANLTIQAPNTESRTGYLSVENTIERKIWVCKETSWLKSLISVVVTSCPSSSWVHLVAIKGNAILTNRFSQVGFVLGKSIWTQ